MHLIGYSFPYVGLKIHKDSLTIGREQGLEIIYNKAIKPWALKPLSLFIVQCYNSILSSPIGSLNVKKSRVLIPLLQPLNSRSLSPDDFITLHPDVHSSFCTSRTSFSLIASGLYSCSCLNFLTRFYIQYSLSFYFLGFKYPQSSFKFYPHIHFVIYH